MEAPPSSWFSARRRIPLTPVRQTAAISLEAASPGLPFTLMDPARHDSSSTSPCPTMVSSARARMEHLNRFLPRPVVAPLQIEVERPSDAGVGFPAMTVDMHSPPQGMRPAQHAIAFAPGTPDIAFLGSDGGLVRTSGGFSDASGGCASRGLTGADLTDCQSWLKAVPTQIFSLNSGLATVQFQSLAINPQHPKTDLIGGSQDNGTWSYNQKPTSAGSNWFESVGGDGGQSLIDTGNPNIRMHTYYGPNGDVNL